jgi:hypothetical protein
MAAGPETTDEALRVSNEHLAQCQQQLADKEQLLKESEEKLARCQQQLQEAANTAAQPMLPGPETTDEALRVSNEHLAQCSASQMETKPAREENARLENAKLADLMHHQQEKEQLSAMVETYAECFSQCLTTHEQVVERVSNELENVSSLRRDLQRESVALKSKLGGYQELENLRSVEAGEGKRIAALWAEKKARDSSRLEKLRLLAIELSQETSQLLDLMKDSRIEIKDAGRSVVQKTMRGFWNTADTNAIIHAMTASPLCTHTQEIGCVTLWSLCQGDNRHEILYQIVQQCGIKTVVRALDVLPQTLTAQEAGCSVLLAICTHIEDAPLKVIENGGVATTLSAIKNHWSSSAVVHSVISFLNVASVHIEDQFALAEKIDLSSIVRAIRSFRSKANVVKSGLELLVFLLAANANNLSKFEDVPVPEAVLESMKNHANNLLVQSSGCEVLNALTSNGKSILRSELQEEAVQLLISSANNFTDNNELLSKVVVSLKCLTHSEKAAEKVTKCGGITCVVAMLRSRIKPWICLERIPSDARTSSAEDRIERTRSIAPEFFMDCFILLRHVACQPTHLAIAREGAISAVIDSMNICMDSLDVQIQGCKTLIAFASFAANSIRIVQGNAAAVISQDLAAFPESAEIQDSAIELLELLAGHSENVRGIVADGLRCLLDCISEEPEDNDAHERNAHLLTACCNVLIKLAVHDEYRDAICAYGAADILLVGIERHCLAPYGAPCVEAGFKALMMLAASSTCQRKIGKKGVELTFRVLQKSKHAAMLGVLQAAVGFMWNLAYDENNLSAIFEHGGVEWVLDVMRKHIEHPKVLEWGCGALWNFACTHENAMRITNLDGIPVIVKSMRRWRHHPDPGLKANGRGALERLPRNVLARVLAEESKDSETMTEYGSSHDLRNVRMGNLSNLSMSWNDILERSFSITASERTSSPTKIRPRPCVTHGGHKSGAQSAVDGQLVNDRSEIICFFCTHPKSRRVELMFQDFRVLFSELSYELNSLFGCERASFVYSWMGVPTAVCDEEAFHACRTHIEDVYCGSGDQALCITVYDHDEISHVLEAVTKATAGVQTSSELMVGPSLSGIMRDDDESLEFSAVPDPNDSSNLTPAANAGMEELPPSSENAGPRRGDKRDSTPTRVVSSASGDARKMLGTITLRHPVARQDTPAEWTFPYYADSTPENLEAEAQAFVRNKGISVEHVHAIVQAALAKRDKALMQEKSRRKKAFKPTHADTSRATVPS